MEASMQETQEVSSQEDVYELGAYQDIAILEKNGILKEDIEKLRQQGIVSVRGVQMVLGKLLANGMDSIKVEKIKKACYSICPQNTGFLSASDIVCAMKISTGCKALDKLLGGGIELGSITEVFGDSCSGKTQLCLTMSVTAQIPSIGADNQKYSGGKVIYIDTVNTFRPNRVSTIADSRNLLKKQVLDNILYAKANNSDHQRELLKGVSSLLIAEPGQYKILIVDVFISHYQSDYINDYVNRQKALRTMLDRLKTLAEEFNVAVLITNHVTNDMKNMEQIKPCGGQVLSQFSTTRILMSRSKSNKLNCRNVFLYGSPTQAQGEVEVMIGALGIQDIPKDDDEVL